MTLRTAGGDGRHGRATTEASSAGPGPGGRSSIPKGPRAVARPPAAARRLAAARVDGGRREFLVIRPACSCSRRSASPPALRRQGGARPPSSRPARTTTSRPSLPELAALVAITVALDFARAIEAEQSRVLGELSDGARSSRVLDVSTRIDLLAFESPEFYDRLQRARPGDVPLDADRERAARTRRLARHGGGRSCSRSRPCSRCCCRSCSSATCPLWFVASLNSRDLYRFMHGMTPNERQRHYLSAC